MKLKPIFELEHYLGIESGFVHDRESNTMAIICIEQTILLAFETREILLQWQTKLQEHFCKGKLYFFSLTPLSFHHKLELFFFVLFLSMFLFGSILIFTFSANDNNNNNNDDDDEKKM